MNLNIDFPNGPTLAYATTSDTGDRIVQYIDRAAVEDPRERAICRALLQHAMDLLDRTEPSRPVAARRSQP
ncbi:hypothetical protein [Streptomyces sp. SGAir0957]